jgi:hypothetical protein
MHTETTRRRRVRLAGAIALTIAVFALAGCNSAAEREAERAGERTREDVRDFRDFLHGRGVTIDTRLPER